MIQLTNKEFPKTVEEFTQHANSIVEEYINIQVTSTRTVYRIQSEIRERIRTLAELSDFDITLLNIKINQTL